VLDLTIAIEIGILLAVFLFIHRMAAVSNVSVITREFSEEEEDEAEDLMSIDRQDVPEGVEVYEINGPFFFGAAYKFKESIQILENPPKVRIIRMRNVPTIDATGLHTLEEVFEQSQKQGTTFIISGIHAQPMATLEQSKLLHKIGANNVVDTIVQALDRAREILEKR
jgi:SulP family sulfate permease